MRLDPASKKYVPADAKVDESVAAMLAERDPAKKLQALHDSDHPQAQFVWAVLRDSFHYSAVHLADIAATARQLRSEEHTSELQSLMRISYAVFCLKKKKQAYTNNNYTTHTYITTIYN